MIWWLVFGGIFLYAVILHVGLALMIIRKALRLLHELQAVAERLDSVSFPSDGESDPIGR